MVSKREPGADCHAPKRSRKVRAAGSFARRSFERFSSVIASILPARQSVHNCLTDGGAKLSTSSNSIADPFTERLLVARTCTRSRRSSTAKRIRAYRFRCNNLAKRCDRPVGLWPISCFKVERGWLCVATSQADAYPLHAVRSSPPKRPAMNAAHVLRVLQLGTEPAALLPRRAFPGQPPYAQLVDRHDSPGGGNMTGRVKRSAAEGGFLAPSGRCWPRSSSSPPLPRSSFANM